MKLRKAFFATLISLVFSSALSLGLCVSWFVNDQSVSVSDLDGSVLKKYFEDGVGTKEEPFEIARPKQYENFVKLHYDMEGFATKGFYFVFGHKFESETAGDAEGSTTTYEYKFFNYNDSGRLLEGKSEVLNMNSIGRLPPIGSDAKPFTSKLDGKGLTVINFTVAGSGYADIGIFGYVAEKSLDEGRIDDVPTTVSNAYFRDFTIDTTEGVYPEIIDSRVEDASLDHEHEDNNVFMGYLAGHITIASSFNNVYVNNCKLTGSKQLVKTVDNYGYYGKADVDSLGGDTGKGSDYKFTLDSEAIYDYLNDNYSTINKERLVVRNTEESGMGNELRKGTYDDPIEFNTAIKKDSVAANFGTTYNLQGNSPTSTGFEHNSSLSTIGYVSGPRTTSAFDYVAKYKDGSSYVNPPASTTITLLSNEENPDPGDYLNYDENEKKWVYYNSSNRLSEPETDKFTLQVDFTAYRRSWNDTIRNLKATTYLYVDDFPVVTFNTTYSKSSRAVNFTLPSETFPNLKLGKHYVGYYSVFEYEIWELFGGAQYNKYTYYYYDTNGIDSNGNLIQKEYEPEYILKTDGSIVAHCKFDLSVKSSFGAHSNGRKEAIGDPTRIAAVPDTVGKVLVCETNTVADMYYENGSQRVQLKSGAENDYENARFAYKDGNWIVTVTKVVLDNSDPSKVKNNWISEEDEIVDSGYSYKNIDIVGGDVKFWHYAQNILFFNIDIKIIALPNESDSKPMVKTITDADVGKVFYATEYATDSIVLYMKNTSNAAAHRNDEMGNIVFEYASIGRLKTADPLFKKGGTGANSYLQLSACGDEMENTPAASSGLTKNIGRTLKENDVQKSCYCALDKDGKILGTFDKNGNTSMTDADLSKIYTYVMLLGGRGSSDDKTWITRVDFEYKAEEGYGGTFGNVGYRSSPDNLEPQNTTILNFSLMLEESSSNNFEITVLYVKAESDPDGYLGDYYIDVYMDAKGTLHIYNYFPSYYRVHVKTTRTGDYADSGGTSAEISLPGNTY